jgi:hypothetical protein
VLIAPGLLNIFCMLGFKENMALGVEQIMRYECCLRSNLTFFRSNFNFLRSNLTYRFVLCCGKCHSSLNLTNGPDSLTTWQLY